MIVADCIGTGQGQMPHLRTPMSVASEDRIFRNKSLLASNYYRMLRFCLKSLAYQTHCAARAKPTRFIDNKLTRVLSL